MDPGDFPEWTLDRNTFKRIFTNFNPNFISNLNPNSNTHSNPNPKAQKSFSEKRNDVIFRPSVQIPLMFYFTLCKCDLKIKRRVQRAKPSNPLKF